MVVPRFPVPVRNVELLPEFADMDAVGVPELTFMNANLDDWVDTPPRRRSTVDANVGESAPPDRFQYVTAPAGQLVPFSRQTD